MDESGQVSFEYLLTVLFGVLLAIIAAILAGNIGAIAQVAQSKILQYREDMIASLIGA